MDEPAHSHQCHICPQCGSHKIHRSPRKGPEDWVRRSFLSQVPYRCEGCDHRFFDSPIPHHPKRDPHRPHPA